MPRHSTPFDLPIKINKKARVNLARQIYESIRQLILDGQLEPGALMPSSRTVASELKVARATVTAAYEQLHEEGYLSAQGGAATSVSLDLPARPATTPQVAVPPPSRTASLSAYGQRISIHEPMYGLPNDLEISFYPWRTARSGRPLLQLSRTIGSVSRTNERDFLDYPSDELGYEPLRRQIAKQLSRYRGIRTNPDQVLVLNGLPQALGLVARLHIERGDLVAVENPGYPQTRAVFASEGASVYPVPVDREGLRVELLSIHAQKFRLAYLTPTHQFPTGVTLSLPRRLELLKFAKQTGTLIVEDEHDSEFHHTKPIPPLKALDEDENVIFMGTFAKTLFPALSLAYLVLPTDLVATYARARELASDQLPTVVQAAVAEFLQEGLYRRHTRRMQELYHERRDALLNALATTFGEKVGVSGHQAGIFLLARFDVPMPSDQFLLRAQLAGVGLVPTKPYYVGPSWDNEYILGYGDLEINEIQEGIRRLGQICEQA